MRVKPLWSELQRMRESFESDQAEQFLSVLRQWLMKNARVLPEKMAQTHPSIAVLLEGRIAEFSLQDKESAMERTERVLSLEPPRNIGELALTIDGVVEEFVVYTGCETCSTCQEGYLRYWVDKGSSKLFLSCPECGQEQDLEGESLKTEGKTFCSGPALKTDLKAWGVIGES